jgi:hypothetical protein
MVPAGWLSGLIGRAAFKAAAAGHSRVARRR